MSTEERLIQWLKIALGVGVFVYLVKRERECHRADTF